MGSCDSVYEIQQYDVDDVINIKADNPLICPRNSEVLPEESSDSLIFFNEMLSSQKNSYDDVPREKYNQQFKTGSKLHIEITPVGETTQHEKQSQPKDDQNSKYTMIDDQNDYKFNRQSTIDNHANIEWKYCFIKNSGVKKLEWLFNFQLFISLQYTYSFKIINNQRTIKLGVQRQS
ncbi:Hypothetical_protein [Hexamita inflata]|uniref:Hypothetical_protein n=1 Tax=Hexamita inflata TaxID=28002 RepID=A0AA86RN13_9EUKA|nr:Hypothetical protein HINF_LOCUS65216 [Hexamita inflata]